MCLLFFEVYFIVFNVQGVRHSPNIAPTKVSNQEGIIHYFINNRYYLLYKILHFMYGKLWPVGANQNLAKTRKFVFAASLLSTQHEEVMGKD